MKKILFLSLPVLAFAACHKEYTCTCNADGSDSTYAKARVKAVSVNRAHEKCYQMEAVGEGCMAK